MEADILQSAFVGGIKSFAVPPHDYEHFSKQAREMGGRIRLSSIEESVYNSFRDYFIGHHCGDLLARTDSLTESDTARIAVATFLTEIGLAVREHGVCIASSGIPQLRIDQSGAFTAGIRTFLASFRSTVAELPRPYQVGSRDAYFALLDIMDGQQFRRYEEAQMEFSFTKDVTAVRSIEQTGRELCGVANGRLQMQKTALKVVLGAFRYFGNLDQTIKEIVSDYRPALSIDLDKNLVVFDASYAVGRRLGEQQEFNAL